MYQITEYTKIVDIVAKKAKTKQFALPVVFDMFLVLFAGFCIAGIMGKVAEYLSYAALVLIGKSGDPISMISEQGLGILMNDPVGGILKSALLLIAILVIILYIVFVYIGGQAWFFSFDLVQKKKEVHRKVFLGRFARITLIFLVPALIYEVLSFILFFVKTSSQRIDPSLDFTLSSIALTIYLFVLVYFFSLSTIFAYHNTTKKALAKAWLKGKEHFLQILPILLILIVAFILLGVIKSNIPYWAMIVAEVIITLPLITLSRMYFFTFVKEYVK